MGMIPVNKILIIEDEKNILLVYKKLLSNNNYEVLTAEDGIKGLELAQEELPDLIILDLVIPKLEGVKVLEALKDDSSTADIPVLVASAKSDKDTIEKVLKLGAANYLVKPIQKEELLTEIKKYL